MNPARLLVALIAALVFALVLPRIILIGILILGAIFLAVWLCKEAKRMEKNEPSCGVKLGQE